MEAPNVVDGLSAALITHVHFSFHVSPSHKCRDMCNDMLLSCSWIYALCDFFSPKYVQCQLAGIPAAIFVVISSEGEIGLDVLHQWDAVMPMVCATCWQMSLFMSPSNIGVDEFLSCRWGCNVQMEIGCTRSRLLH